MQDIQWFPPMDCYETEKEYRIEILLPGVSMKDIEISLYGNELQIKGKRQISHSGIKGFHRIERPFGSFKRSVYLRFKPSERNILTTYEHGVLKLTIKKDRRDD